MSRLLTTDDGGDDNSASINDTTGIYLGIYLAYFLGLVFVAYLLDRMKVVDKLINSLGNSAHKSFLRYEYENAKTGKTKKSNKSEKSGSGCCGSSKKIAPDPVAVAPVSTTPSVITGPVNKPVLRQGCVEYLICGQEPEVEYNPLFMKKLLSSAAYWGSKTEHTCCYAGSIFFSDFLFYLLNHHIILSMFSASLQHPLSRGERRVAFMVQHSVAFFFAALIIYMKLDPMTNTLINIFAITPFTLLVNYSYYYMLACPCLIREYRWNICKCCASCLECMGKVIAYPLSLGSIILLLMAAMFTQNDSYTALARYAYQVHLVSTFTDFLMTAVRFLHDHYFKFKVLGFTVFEVGNWFKEMVEIFDLEKDTGYTETTKTLIPLLLTMVQWTRVPGVVRPLPVEGDIEMQSVPHTDGASLPTVASPSAEGGLSPVTAVAAVDPVVATPHSILEDQRALEMLAKPWPTAQTASERTPAIESNVDDLYNKIYGGAAAAAAPSAE